MNENSLVATHRTKRLIELKWLKSTDPIIPKLMGFLRLYFHPNEPLNRSIDLMNNEQDCKTLDALYTSCFPFDASVVALDPKDGSIVGVLLNNVITRGGHEEEILDENWNPSKVYGKFLDLITSITEEMDLFTKYPRVNKILDHAILSVRSDWQGDGLSQILINYSNNTIAKELDCGLSFVICSSLFSAKAFERCGYFEIWRKKFRDYNDGNKILFPTDPPHDFIICKLLELNKDNNKK